MIIWSERVDSRHLPFQSIKNNFIELMFVLYFGYDILVAGFVSMCDLALLVLIAKFLLYFFYSFRLLSVPVNQQWTQLYNFIHTYVNLSSKLWHAKLKSYYYYWYVSRHRTIKFVYWSRYLCFKNDKNETMTNNEQTENTKNGWIRADEMSCSSSLQCEWFLCSLVIHSLCEYKFQIWQSKNQRRQVILRFT